MFFTCRCRHPQHRPFFASSGGSIDIPGVEEVLYDGSSVWTYEVHTVAANETLVVEYVSAGVIDGPADPTYPAEIMNGLGKIGYTTTDGRPHYHTIPFRRSEPKATMHASQTIRLYVPPKTTLFVSLPHGNLMRAAQIDVSGYTIKN